MFQETNGRPRKTMVRKGDFISWQKDAKSVVVYREIGVHLSWGDKNMKSAYLPFIESEGDFFNFVFRTGDMLDLTPVLMGDKFPLPTCRFR